MSTATGIPAAAETGRRGPAGWPRWAVILLAVLALVVVNALKDSPWGVFTILCTIPVAVLMGFWMKVWRPGRTLEASVFGVVLLLLALVGGRYVAAGRAQLDHLGTRATATVSLSLVGAGRGAALQTEVLPSIFH